MLIKYYIFENIDTTIRRQALVAFMGRGISQKDALMRPKDKFVGIVGSKIRKAATSKGSKKRIIRKLTKEDLQRNNSIEGSGGESVD